MFNTLIYLPRLAGALLKSSSQGGDDEAPVRPDPAKVGGQAVLEGVMMRSENSFAVACRRADGRIVVRESEWRSIQNKFRFLRWPFFRGSIVLIESLVNGFSALSFSAAQMEETNQNASSPEVDGDSVKPGSTGIVSGHQAKKSDSLKAGKESKESGELSGPMIGLTFAASIALALALFVGVPHLLSLLLGLKTDTFLFHIVDGVIKVFMVVGYMAAISFMPEIRRVYMYHGAEHQSIAAYEADDDLVVERAKTYSRFHPRCGTSFLFIVILVSILLFAALLRTPWVQHGVLDQVLKVFVKIPLMLPVAGISYEALKLSGKLKNSRLAMIVVAPGLWLQRLTTREPDDEQRAVALAALRKTLWRENTLAEGRSSNGDASTSRSDTRNIEVFDSYKEIVYEQTT